MFLTPLQLAAPVLTVCVAASTCGALVFRRGVPRRGAYIVLCVCAVVSIASWIRFGDFHTIFVDAGDSDFARSRKKIERHEPLHFHEFFHYYLGSKYFRELGYLGLYDCAALGDQEIAAEQGVQPRIGGYVRDLDDVLRDKPYESAVVHCRDDLFPRFSSSRWAQFKRDLRELQRLVPDDWWGSVVYDAGFNPPPSWVVLSTAIANLIPIRAGPAPTYLLATSLDAVLLVACFLAIRASFGDTTAVVAAVFFGASFISNYTWNGGAFLRFTWFAAVVFSLAAMKRDRWLLAGALLGAATCDRLFPAGFAAGAMVPLAVRSLRSDAHRRILVQFGAGFAAALLVLVVASVAVFGVSPWGVFASRILRHGDIYYVMHIGLKKVMTFRDWVPSQNFHGHDGLARFHDWNVRLRATWADVRPLTIPIQALAAGGAVYASTRVRPYEAALLCGVVFMFVFNLPANYYFVVLTLVPAILVRRAATATSMESRSREYVAFAAFSAFWTVTLAAPHLWGDDIIYDFVICSLLAAFLGVWIVVWANPPWSRWVSSLSRV